MKQTVDIYDNNLVLSYALFMSKSDQRVETYCHHLGSTCLFVSAKKQFFFFF